MSSMENGRSHCGFRPIRRPNVNGHEPKGSCPLFFQRTSRKKSGSMYDER